MLYACTTIVVYRLKHIGIDINVNAHKKSMSDYDKNNNRKIEKVNDELIWIDLPPNSNNNGSNNRKKKREIPNCVEKSQWTWKIMYNMLYLNVNKKKEF